MVEIKSCTLHTENERNGVDLFLADGGAQDVSAEGTIGVGAVTGTDVVVRLIVSGQAVREKTIFMLPGDNGFNIGTTLGPPETNPLLPSPPSSAPVEIKAVPKGGGVDDRVRCGTLRIRTGFDTENVELIAGSCSLSTTEISEGDLVEFAAQVRNRNDIEAEVTVTGTANGDVLFRQRRITIPAQGEKQVSQSLTWRAVRSQVGDGDLDIELDLASVTQASPRAMATFLENRVGGVDRGTLATAAIGAGAGLAGMAAAKQ